MSLVVECWEKNLGCCLLLLSSRQTGSRVEGRNYCVVHLFSDPSNSPSVLARIEIYTCKGLNTQKTVKVQGTFPSTQRFLHYRYLATYGELLGKSIDNQKSFWGIRCALLCRLDNQWSSIAFGVLHVFVMGSSNCVTQLIHLGVLSANPECRTSVNSHDVYFRLCVKFCRFSVGKPFTKQSTGTIVKSKTGSNII